jgi:hypothetical protein
MTTAKKFRFDSFASEFASKDETSVTTTTTSVTTTTLDQTADNDSGIGESLFYIY